MMTMNRRSFSAAMVVGAAASLISTRGTAATRFDEGAQRRPCARAVCRRRPIPGMRVAFGNFLANAAVILAPHPAPRCHIDKGETFGFMPASVTIGEGMPNQDRRTILPRQHALGRGYRFRQRRKRILHGCD